MSYAEWQIRKDWFSRVAEGMRRRDVYKRQVRFRQPDWGRSVPGKALPRAAAPGLWWSWISVSGIRLIRICLLYTSSIDCFYLFGLLFVLLFVLLSVLLSILLSVQLSVLLAVLPSILPPVQKIVWSQGLHREHVPTVRLPLPECFPEAQSFLFQIRCHPSMYPGPYNGLR